MNLVVVFLFGALGGLLRYTAVDIGLYGTLLVNLCGTFMLGASHVLMVGKGRPRWLQIGVEVGFLGALTTFSTFTTDTVGLAASSWLMPLLYIAMSIIGGLALYQFGVYLAKAVSGGSSHEQADDHQEDARDEGRTLA